MSFLIDASEPRSLKAIEIAATAGQWLRVKANDGRALWGIPSACQPGRFYLTDQHGCDCEDAKRHPGQDCKHVLAVRLYEELARAVQPKQPTPLPQRPVLEMIREADGSVRWEPHQHKAPVPAEITAQRARLYTQIHRDFGEDY